MAVSLFEAAFFIGCNCVELQCFAQIVMAIVVGNKIIKYKTLTLI